MNSIFQVLGGMALLLFGVRMLSTGMEKLAGNQIQKWLDRMTGKPIKGAVFGAVATALIQSSSLLMVTMIGLFPFVKHISRAVELLVPKSVEEEESKLTVYIDARQYRLPPVALTEALKELTRMGDVTAEMIDRGHIALIEDDIPAAEWVLEQESEFVDPVCVILEDFVNTLMQENLSVTQQRRCLQLKNLIVDIERVGDLTENLAQAAQKKVSHSVTFSPQAMEDLDRLCQHTHRTYVFALQALRDGDQILARRACRLEDEFDRLYLEARQGHIDRLERGICQPKADVIFIEALRNLERISDHADNLGISVMRV